MQDLRKAGNYVWLKNLIRYEMYWPLSAQVRCWQQSVQPMQDRGLRLVQSFDGRSVLYVPSSVA